MARLTVRFRIRAIGSGEGIQLGFTHALVAVVMVVAPLSSAVPVPVTVSAP